VSDSMPDPGATVQLSAQLFDTLGNAIAHAGLEATWIDLVAPGQFSSEPMSTDSAGQVHIDYQVSSIVGTTHQVVLQTVPGVSGISPLIRVTGQPLAGYVLFGPDTARVGQSTEAFTLLLYDGASNRILADQDLGFTLSLDQGQGFQIRQLQGQDTTQWKSPMVQIQKGQSQARFLLRQNQSGQKTLSITEITGATGLQGNTLSILFLPGDASSFALKGGDGQQGPLSQVLPTPLQVVIRDGFGNAVPGAKVTWEIFQEPLQSEGAGFGASASEASINPLPSLQVFSDSAGVALAAFTFGSVAGPYQVRASLEDASGQSLDEIFFNLEALPDKFALEGNYPNPFSGQTTIPIQVPEASDVTLEVFDVLGGRVQVLLEAQRVEPGRHLILFDARALASDIYIVRMVARGADGRTFRANISMTIMNR